MRLKDKIAIVTGSSRGLGEAISKLFARESAEVIGVDISGLPYTNPKIEEYKLDITDTNGCKEFFDYVMEKYKKIDVLVNNAGITRDALTANMTDEDWDSVIDVNLKGIFNMTRYIGPHMQSNGKGSIISISSISGEFGNVGQANYSAAKAGVLGLTATWAKEFALRGGNVRVNAILPGIIMTDIVKTVPKHILDKFIEQTILGRIGEPEEVANAALFLASDESSYITGHTLNVDGGIRF